MKLILITGKTGSGKNKLGDAITKEGNFFHVDIDKICHTCYENDYIVNKVREYFGNQIVEEGIVNRKRLGAIVFNDRSKMEKLSELTYNYVIDKIDEVIANNEDKIIILNYVLLPNTKYWNYNCYKILVECENNADRYNHLMQRDNVTMEYILSRDNNSLNYNREDFDYIFINNYTQNNLEENIKKIMEDIKNK